MNVKNMKIYDYFKNNILKDKIICLESALELSGYEYKKNNIVEFFDNEGLVNNSLLKSYNINKIYQLEPEDIIEKNGIKYTTPLRSLYDYMTLNGAEEQIPMSAWMCDFVTDTIEVEEVIEYFKERNALRVFDELMKFYPDAETYEDVILASVNWGI